MELSPVVQKFILHWGEMGTRWGINRTVAQVHALLYISQRPLPADEISTTLAVARSNVSTALRDLQGWGIVKRVHALGDRRDHFESLADVWELFRVILAERKRREIDPTLQVLKECVERLDTKRPADLHVAQRLNALLDFFNTTCAWYDEVSALPKSAVVQFVKLGSKVSKVLRRKPG